MTANTRSVRSNAVLVITARLAAAGLLLAAALAIIGTFQAAEAAGRNAKKPPPSEPVCDSFDPEVVFHRANSGTDSDLMAANADGSCQTVVLDGDEVDYEEPNWLPDGSGIVFFASAPYPNAPDFGIYYLYYDDILNAAMAQPTPQLIVAVQSDVGGLVRPNPGPSWTEPNGSDREYEIVYGDAAPVSENDIYLLKFSVSGDYVTNVGPAAHLVGNSGASLERAAASLSTNWLDANHLITACLGLPGYSSECNDLDYRILQLTNDRSGIASDQSLFGRYDCNGKDVIDGFNYTGADLMPSHDGLQLATSNGDILIIDVDNPCTDPTNLTNNAEWAQASPTWTADDGSVTYRQWLISSACGEKGKFSKTNLIILRPVDELKPCFNDKLMEFPAGTGPTRVQWRPWP